MKFLNNYINFDTFFNSQNFNFFTHFRITNCKKIRLNKNTNFKKDFSFLL